MVLLSTSGNIPKNAVPLSRKEALEYQWNQIGSWPNSSDVWPFRWGYVGLGVLAAVSGMYINGRYRRKLKLRHYGYVSTSFPMIIGPAMFSSMFHLQVITHDVLLTESKCPLCLQYKAVMVQIASGIVYPLVMSPIANFLYAMRHATYRLPYWTDAKATLGLWWNFTKPMGQSLLVFICVQALATGYLTYLEAENLYKMRIKLMKLEEEAYIEKAKRAANVMIE